MRKRTGLGSATICWGWAIILLLSVACGVTGVGPADETGAADFQDVPADAAIDLGIDLGIDRVDVAPDSTVDTIFDALPFDALPFDALTCPDVQGTSKTLREKAEFFDSAAVRWHLPAGQDLLFNAVLKDDLQTFDHVDMSDNVGLWTSTYTASQAFRYAATRSPDALQNLRRTVRGEHDLMLVTGVPGLFSRVAIDPNLPGFPSQEWLRTAYADCDLQVAHCKRFNEVTQGDYAGRWFKNDVSKDEYSGHMFAMGVILEVVDDPEVRARATDIVTQVGQHLADHGLRLTDIDGQTTAYGYMNALSFNDFPGFNAVLSLSWTRLAASVAGGSLLDFYRNCLLQQGGELQCIPDESPAPYTDYLDQVGLDLGCLTNWNNHNMAQLAMYPLIRYEDDPVLKARYQAALRYQLWNPTDARPMRDQQNSLYTFFYLVNRDPADPWPAKEAQAALCTLKRFPESKAHHAVDTVSRYPEACIDRGGDPLADVVIPIEERSMDNFLWTGNPYSLEQEAEDLHYVDSPEDYLLAYWMGRYFGLITADM